MKKPSKERLTARVFAVKETGADIGIGLEGGVQETPHGLFLCNWGSLVTSKDLEPILGGGARILLPEAVAGMLRHDKKELAEAMEVYTNQKNIRKKKEQSVFSPMGM